MSVVPVILSGRQAFDPRATLFAHNEPGVWYDPTDLGAMFTTSDGTTPVTGVEQAVGLILDKSRGLAIGPELVTNGDFSNGTTGWTATDSTLAVVSGELEITATASPGPYAGQTITTVTGRSYRMTGSLRAPSANSTLNAARVRLYRQSNLAAQITTPVTTGTPENSTVTFSFVFVAEAATTFIQLGVASDTAWGAIGDKAYFDNISVREIAGTHAIQPTAASRPVLRNRYNLLTFSEQFNDAAWTKSSVTVSANSDTAPDGTTTADTLAATGANGTTLSSFTALAASYTFLVWLKRKTGTGNIDISAHSGGTWVTQTITSSWALYTVTQTLSAGASTPGIRIVTSGDEVYAWGADLRSANDTIYPYQRIEAATVYDSDTSKFPLYLACDGSDDSLYTAANLNLSSTDKVTVFAGFTRLQSVLNEIVLETSTDWSQAGALGIVSLNTGVIGWRATGSASATVDAAVSTPSTAVYTGTADIPADNTAFRVNGAQAGSSSANLGTGNFASAVLYVGRRTNSTLPFNGRIHQLIVRGAASSAAEISSTERWVAGKQGRAL